MYMYIYIHTYGHYIYNEIHIHKNYIYMILTEMSVSIFYIQNPKPKWGKSKAHLRAVELLRLEASSPVLEKTHQKW